MRVKGRDIYCHGAFTLIEVVLSSMIVSTLMIAMGSAVVVASRAIPTNNSPGIAAANQARAFDILSSDLAEALYFDERTPTSVGFTVPDRDGDGNPEHVRYAWAGTIGDPLTRAYNIDSPTDLISSLDSLSFASEIMVTTSDISGVPIAGAEQLVKSHVATGMLGYVVNKPLEVGESFLPSLPGGAIAWRLTTIEPYLKSSGTTNGTLAVRLNGTLPSGVPDSLKLYEVRVPESSLPNGSYRWHPIAFGADNLDPARRYAITFHDAGDGKAAQMANDTGLAARPDQSLVLSTGTWSVVSDESLFYRIFGIPMYASSPITVARSRVASMGVDLVASGSFSSGARCLNAPEVLDGLWSLDFSLDPTTADIDADGVSDWVVPGGSTFDSNSISSGIWTPTQKIESTPRRPFTTPLTMDLKIRDSTANDGNGARVDLYIDHDGTRGARLRLCVVKTGANEQEILFTSKRANNHDNVLHVSTVSTSAFLSIRIIALPASNTVNLRVDGEDLGSFQYYLFGTLGQGRIELSARGGDLGVQFDSAMIRVSPAP